MLENVTDADQSRYGIPVSMKEKKGEREREPGPWGVGMARKKIH